MVNSAFTEMMLSNLIPMVEKTFRTAPGRENRAMAGLSMGGAQTLGTALANLDELATIGGFSGSSGGRSRSIRKTSNAGVFADAAAFNKQVKVLFLGIGSAKRCRGTKASSERLTQLSIKNIYYESPRNRARVAHVAALSRRLRAATVPLTLPSQPQHIGDDMVTFTVRVGSPGGRGCGHRPDSSRGIGLAQEVEAADPSPASPLRKWERTVE